jgi:diguanylate cyclase (GGDEF)-like protein
MWGTNVGNNPSRQTLLVQRNLRPGIKERPINTAGSTSPCEEAAMSNTSERPTTRYAPMPELSVPSQNEWESWSIRILLLALVLDGLIPLLLPGISTYLRIQIGSVPQVLIGFTILALVFYLHLELQRKRLRKVSSALLAATSYVDRLEQVSFVDPHTQLFNRKYLDQLFNQQLKWLNRNGKPATLLLFEVLPDGQDELLNEMVVESAFVLRSNFRGSDYLVRSSTYQFLAMLPDTTEDQAQNALTRLNDKMDTRNLENEKYEMVLKHEITTCLPGGDLWELLRELEEKLNNKSRVNPPILLAPVAAARA